MTADIIFLVVWISYILFGTWIIFSRWWGLFWVLPHCVIAFGSFFLYIMPRTH